MKTLLKIMLVVVVLAGAGAGGWWYWSQHAKPPITFRTVEATTEDLLQSIAATGTAEPEETVDVGAQVSGLIDKFGADRDHAGKFVDYGTHVQLGDLLAHIDESLYQSDVDTAKAQLAQAKANLLGAQAALLQMQAKLVQAQNDWDRAQQLGPSDALAKSDYDMYQANYLSAKANVAAAEAGIAQNQAAVQGADAALTKANRNIDYCKITSPVNGVVIARRVNVGQTVASSLSAPSLFLLAEDLKRMQVWASVNEADIGSIYAGQPVTFTVDTFPGRVFKGEVGMVRLDATMTSNVVTYTVEINTTNSDGKLLPYMTCNVQFEVARRASALTVPNTALRYLPQEAAVAPESREEFEKIVKERNGGHASHPGGKVLGTGAPGHATTRSPNHDAAATQPHEHHRGAVWVADAAGLLKPVTVTTGITDGVDTEITSSEIKSGQAVVVGEYTADEAASSNPFAPQFHRH